MMNGTQQTQMFKTGTLSFFCGTSDGLQTERLCLTNRIFYLIFNKTASPQDDSYLTKRVSSTNFELIEVYVGIVAEINS